MRTTLALLLLAGVCVAQTVRVGRTAIPTDPKYWQISDIHGTVISCDWGTPLKNCKLGEGRTLADSANAYRELLDTVNKQWREDSARQCKLLPTCVSTLRKCSRNMEQLAETCAAEADQLHLPENVNPGDCFRVNADMSITVIACPKESE